MGRRSGDQPAACFVLGERNEGQRVAERKEYDDDNVAAEIGGGWPVRGWAKAGRRGVAAAAERETTVLRPRSRPSDPNKQAEGRCRAQFAAGGRTLLPSESETARSCQLGCGGKSSRLGHNGGGTTSYRFH